MQSDPLGRAMVPLGQGKHSEAKKKEDTLPGEQAKRSLESAGL
jgi:hypothetical protein